jgi:hypothetical protein
MFSTSPRIGTFIISAILTAFVTIMDTSSCGEVTTTMPSTGRTGTPSGHVARSGRQIDEHEIDVRPDDLRPELLDGTGDDRPLQTTGSVSSGRSTLMDMMSMPIRF